jgi:hypothetical protein
MSTMLRSGFTCAFLVSTAVSIAAAGCDDGGDHGGSGEGPTAPTNLVVAPLAGGAHLTWADNSDNETEFMVMRMKVGTDSEYQHITSVVFNTVQYHDGPITAGEYKYQVWAMNSDGESESEEVSFTAP